MASCSVSPSSGPAPPQASTSLAKPPAESAYFVKAGILGALIGLAAYVARRHMRLGRGQPAGGESLPQHLQEQPEEGGGECAAPGAAAAAGKGPPGAHSALRKGSAELTLLGSFAQESWKALSSLSRSSSSSAGGSGSSTSGSSSARSAVGSGGQHAPFFDSATSRSAKDVDPETDSGGNFSSAPSSLMTDVTKLPHDWNIVEFGELELAKTIGEGSFGQVWLAKYCQTIVAVKVLNHHKAFNATNSMHERTMMRALSKEVSIMASLRHPCCTQYLGVCLDPPCLLMEYCSRKSVDNILSTAATDPKVARQLSWARLLGMAADAAKGMLYLHSRHPPILHRDLKSANLLVDAHWHVKVADFNLSRADDQSIASTVTITNPRWLAPEVLQGGQAQLASDVWAFGTVLWEFMTWQLPFEKHNPFQIIVTVTNAEDGSGLPIPGPEQLPAGPFSSYTQYVELMKACWARDPADRPTMDAVVSALLPMLSLELRRNSTSGSGTLAPSASGALATSASGALVLAASGALGATTPSPSVCADDRGAVIGISREVSAARSGLGGSSCLGGSGGSEAAAAAAAADAGTGKAAGAGVADSLFARAGSLLDPRSPFLNVPVRSTRRSIDLLRSESESMPTPFGATAPLERGNSLLPPLKEPPLRNATQELMAAGYCTVANAGCSQMDSGRRDYPFVSNGFFAQMRSELLE